MGSSDPVSKKPLTVVRNPECTKIARFSAAAVAILTAPQKIARFFEAPRCAISSAKKIASEPRFILRRKWVKVVLAADFLAIPSSAIKIASERRCAILVHSGEIGVHWVDSWKPLLPRSKRPFANPPFGDFAFPGSSQVCGFLSLSPR